MHRPDLWYKTYSLPYLDYRARESEKGNMPHVMLLTLYAMFFPKFHHDVSVHLLQNQLQGIAERRFDLRSWARLLLSEDQASRLVHDVHADDTHGIKQAT